MEDLGYIGCGTIAYALYVQFSPKMGNVWIRPNSEGEKSIVFNSLIHLMKESSIRKEFWKIKNLDMNYTFFTFTIWSGMKGISYMMS